MSRDQIVRDTAYAIWEAEGKPDGRHAEHWRLAEARVASSLDKTPDGGKVSARAKADTAPKPSAAKPAASKSAPRSKKG